MRDFPGLPDIGVVQPSAYGVRIETLDTQRRNIVGAGDITVDWLEYTVPAVDRPEDEAAASIPNYRLRTGIRMEAREGTALLLARLVRAATSLPVLTHEVPDLRQVPPEKVIHSLAELRQVPRSTVDRERKTLVYRVWRAKGFSGPAGGAVPSHPVSNDDPDAAIVLLDDAANGFRDAREAWPAALVATDRRPIVVLKMSRPLQRGPLWECVRQRHWDRLVLVLNADDVRAEGVNIARQLSWERTAREFVWQLASNPRLLELASCRNLIVRFGVEGAIHYWRRPDGEGARLYYDPTLVEDGFREICPGGMLGLTDAFVAGLNTRLLEDGLDGVTEGIRDGIRASRHLYRAGFGPDPDRIDYPKDGIFDLAGDALDRIADVLLPRSSSTDAADPDFWSILSELGTPKKPPHSLRTGQDHLRLEEVAFRIVREGVVSALADVPVGRFGDLWTVDRAEIESFRSIQNLMRQYVKLEKPKRPLSIAVFGPPGSGKSFGVTQVAKSVAEDVEQMEFNLSQLESYADLIGAFHRVRDKVLAGKLPVVFFDEFDSHHDRPLGWLKFFLAPMQDGTFREGEALHPIGRAIFVFAGGTKYTFQAFADPGFGESDGARADVARANFRSAKGPDFLSRLRGYVDISGPDPLHPAERLYLIRRAVILRSLFERNWRNLLDPRGRPRIDEGVLRAFIKVPHYRHGVRSMEAILDMSLLVEREAFDQAALPPPGQLEQHVEAVMFSRLVDRDVLLGGERERIAAAIHEKFRRDQANRKQPDDLVMRPWEELDEGFKESNRSQADDIPRKLKAIGCGFVPVGGGAVQLIEFRQDEIEKLAEQEHERFNTERRRTGWRSGPRDPVNKVSPYLIPWHDLAEDVKEFDRETVRGIPEFMADAGFEIYRL